MEQITPAPGRVKEIRDTFHVGLLEAWEMALRESMNTAVDNVSSWEDVRKILRTIVEHTRFRK